MYKHTDYVRDTQVGQGCHGCDSLPRQLLFLCEQEFDLLTRLWATLHTVYIHSYLCTAVTGST